MPDLSIDMYVDEHGRDLVGAKFSNDTWELNVRATRSDLLGLAAIRAMDWGLRAMVHVGMCAGADVFWSSDGRIATITVGHDDETWDMAVSLPVELVDDLVRQVQDL